MSDSINVNIQKNQQMTVSVYGSDSSYIVLGGNYTTSMNTCCSTCVNEGPKSTECKVVNTILNNPTWGWILFVAIAVFVFYKQLTNILDIHCQKIKNSKVYSGKFGSYEFSCSQVDEADSKAFDGKDEKQNTDSADESVYYYPAFEDILGNETANKILSTLWKYQQDYGAGNNNVNRWGFTLNENSFQIIAKKLHWSGLIISNGSIYMLSNVGIRFCKKYEDKLHMDKLYGPFVSVKG